MTKDPAASGRDAPGDTPRIEIAATDEGIARCFEVLSQLRSFRDASEFVRRMQELAASGYVVAYLEVDGEVQTVAGYRILDHLWGGRALYVEDLVTRADRRSEGHGARMFEWLVARAGTLACTAVHLDSGVQREGAHRFYFAQGMTITDFHFELRLR